MALLVVLWVVLCVSRTVKVRGFLMGWMLANMESIMEYLTQKLVIRHN